jgi:hypothetical protein
MGLQSTHRDAALGQDGGNPLRAGIALAVGMPTVMLSDELRNQFRHNSPVYGTRIAT